MKLARWAAQGRIINGTFEDGELVGTDGVRYNPEEAVWLPPSEPQKIIGIALNFADHAEELKLEKPELPAIFIKPSTSLIGHKGKVLMPPGSAYMHYEAELVAIIGKRCRAVKAANALDVVAGYTIGNDITVRDKIGKYFRPPLIAKGWDTFGPVGPYMVTPDEAPDPSDMSLRTFVNGQLRQEGNTRNLIFSLPELIEHISMIMTLEPGDQIWTGTPKGISHIYPGDIIRIEIDGIGALESKIVLGPKL
ncbi:MAG: fumarylacetoacetate hydrolase family protein [Candidatus Zixiibacteriota bacterium]